MASALEPPPAIGLDTYEEQMQRSWPGYLDQVRDQARRLGLRAKDSTDARSAVEAVEDLAVIDVVAPTASRRPAGRLIKTLIAKAIAWYLGYLGGQITALGQSVAHMGATLLERTEVLERHGAEMRADLDDLAARVQRLESGGPAQ
jgi:hypothetical protein